MRKSLDIYNIGMSDALSADSWVYMFCIQSQQQFLLVEIPENKLQRLQGGGSRTSSLSSAGTNADTDAGTNADTDASTDAGTKASTDAGTNASTNAGTNAGAGTIADTECGGGPMSTRVGWAVSLHKGSRLQQQWHSGKV